MKTMLSAAELKASYENPLNVKLARQINCSVAYDKAARHTDVAICLAKKPASARELCLAIVNYEWMEAMAGEQFDRDCSLREWAERCFDVYTEITRDGLRSLSESEALERDA